jgi:hypothetical protein
MHLPSEYIRYSHVAIKIPTISATFDFDLVTVDNGKS